MEKLSEQAENKKQFLQEVVEPEVQVPVEPEFLQEVVEVDKKKETE